MTASRRAFLARLARLGAGVVVSQGLSACGTDTPESAPGEGIAADFRHGVASGDPLPDRVILWTRVSPVAADGTAVVSWEVAGDAAFRDRTHSGEARVDRDSDYTLKVDVQGLLAGQRYYYRFRCGASLSPIGETRTLPTGHVESVRLAVVSCANYPAGYFNVYRELAARDTLDAVVHLGDYLYEYGSGGYATEQAERIGRALPTDASSEALTLADYRARYALYREDTDLAALHARHAVIAVWDDHEIANDAWQDGAENHDADEGDYAARRSAALQAWFEWMPVRAPDDGISIYRAFAFGDLVNLAMLDTRHLARDRPLDYTEFLGDDGTTFEEVRFRTALADPDRALLGAAQTDWLTQQWQSSEATWQVLGQQVLVARMHVPQDVLRNPDPAAILELYDIRLRIAEGDPTVTGAERALFDNPIPYNLDAWDGYPVVRDALLDTAAELDINLVTLAGDTHNAWASDLASTAGEAVGVEFGAPSVSSPGLERYLGLDTQLEVRQAELALVAMVDTLRYANISQRGWLEVAFSHEDVRADWYFVSTVASPDYVLDTARERHLRALAGDDQRRVVAAST